MQGLIPVLVYCFGQSSTQIRIGLEIELLDGPLNVCLAVKDIARTSLLVIGRS